MCEYYFHKWKRILEELEKHVKIDIEYQSMKAHEQTCCGAAQRLGGVLAKYMSLYNDSVDCVQQNLQVQKTRYLGDVVHAITARILELKHHLRKLEEHNYQYIGKGLVQNILTYDDADPKGIHRKMVRSERMQAMIEEVMLRAKVKKALEYRISEEEEKVPTKENIITTLWEDDDENNDEEITNISEVKDFFSEESIQRLEMVKLIQAHERSRQVIRWKTERQFKRDMWVKELQGTLKPDVRLEVKQGAARLIKKSFRAYFQIKRQRMSECKIDEMLSIKLCNKLVTKEKTKDEKIKQLRLNKQKQYKKDWTSNYQVIKDNYMKDVEDKIYYEYKDFIREWFRKWFDEVKFFYDIPNEEQGGSSLIIKDDVPTPSEWQAEYETYLEEKKANKNKTSLQKKFEKMEAKREEMKLKKEEQIHLKQEQELKKKMMKNPNMHPGYNYPVSKKTKQILKVIEIYHNDWKDYDALENEGVKEGSVKEIDKSNACMNTQMQILKTVDEDMREELKILKRALQNDYTNNNEKMPEKMIVKVKKTKRRRKLKSAISEKVQDKMEDLTVAGFLKEYSNMKLEGFLGEYNFAGDDLRCILQITQPLGGEMRSLWWEKCNELVHGVRRVLLIGPQGSGKSTLVQILASVNDAVLFELDPSNVSQDLLSSMYLRQVVTSVVTCARAVQPSVIHLKCLHLLYCKKVPHGQNKKDLNTFKQYFVQYLLKRIRKNDLITVIGSCCDPWLTKTSKLLKIFSDVVMLPATTYSTVSLILRNWMSDNRIVPRDFNLQSIAQLLQGYSFGYLKEALNSFLIPENIVKIAAYGLSPKEVIDHVTRNGTQDKIDYEKYNQWYTENTVWGKKEAKRLQEDRDFKLLAEKFSEKQKKKDKQNENIKE